MHRLTKSKMIEVARSSIVDDIDPKRQAKPLSVWAAMESAVNRLRERVEKPSRAAQARRGITRGPGRDETSDQAISYQAISRNAKPIHVNGESVDVHRT